MMNKSVSQVTLGSRSLNQTADVSTVVKQVATKFKVRRSLLLKEDEDLSKLIGQYNDDEAKVTSTFLRTNLTDRLKNEHDF
jgi:hypothetical protein